MAQYPVSYPSPLPELTEGMSPEVELLLCCARTCMDPRTAERIQTLRHEAIDWEHLLRLASGHGMVSLLHWHLSAICPEAVPEPSRSDLEAGFRAHTVRNLRLTQELIRLLERFGEHGIPAIPWKGPILAIAIYGSLSLRKSGDLDILIAPEDMWRARDLMLSLGYQVTTPLEADGFPSQSNKYEFAFVSPEGGIIVELRWRVQRRHFLAVLDHRRLWEQRETVVVSGANLPRLPAEESLLILCMHGSKHGWSRLLWICDIAELVRARPHLDWQRVQEQARALGCGRILALGLFLARGLLGAHVPDSVFPKAQADPVVRSLAAQVCARLSRVPYGLADVEDVNSPAAVRRRALFDYRVTERLADRIHYGLILLRRRLTPNERDRTFLRLPTFLHFLYFLFRPVRLAAEHGPARIRRFLRSRKQTPPLPTD